MYSIWWQCSAFLIHPGKVIGWQHGSYFYKVKHPSQAKIALDFSLAETVNFVKLEGILESLKWWPMLA